MPICSCVGVQESVSKTASVGMTGLQREANNELIRLNPTTDANLPVQFFVVSGSVQLADDDTTLQFLPIPPRTKFPMQVIIGSYQGGRVTDPKVQTGMPVYQRFWINKE